MRGNPDTVEGEFEKLQRGFVGLSLLCSDDFVEVHPKLGSRAGEKVIIDVGKNRQPEATLELAKSGDGVGPGLPGGKRLGQRAYFVGTRSKAKLRAKLAHDRLQDFAIGTKRT